MAEQEKKTVNDSLTEKQKAFLASCEKDFADRYTAKDKEYELFVNSANVPPPCIHPWPPYGGNREGGYQRRDDRDRRRDR